MKNLILAFVTFSLISCANKEEKSNVDVVNTEMTEDTSAEQAATLQALLIERKESWHLEATNKKKEMVNNHINDIISDSILHKAIQKGEKAPDFTLTNAEGENVSLYSQLEKGPVVLIWYRGGWCPYCNLTLHALQEELPNIISAGGNLIALTPELPDNSLDTKEKHDLQFEVLSDVGNKVGHQFGIVYDLTPELADEYHKSFNIHAQNGDTSNQLPLAATYVIDQRGFVEYAFLDADYRNRAEPREITDVLLYLKDHAGLNSN